MGKKRHSDSESSSSDPSASSGSDDDSLSSASESSETSESSSSSSSEQERRSKKSSKSKSKKSSSKKDSKSKKGKKDTKKKAKGKKKKKDPNAPKRSLSSYFFYTAKRRIELKAEGSTLKPTELTRQFGVEWKALTEEQRAPFVALAEKDKLRYAKAKAEYKPAKRSASSSDSNDSDSDKPKKKKTKKDKDPNAPKKPMNGYMFFANENREKVKSENPKLKATEVVTELGAQWKALSIEDRKPYAKMAEDDKVRYATALEKYNANK